MWGVGGGWGGLGAGGNIICDAPTTVMVKGLR